MGKAGFAGFIMNPTSDLCELLSMVWP